MAAKAKIVPGRRQKKMEATDHPILLKLRMGIRDGSICDMSEIEFLIRILFPCGCSPKTRYLKSAFFGHYSVCELPKIFFPIEIYFPHITVFSPLITASKFQVNWFSQS